MFSILPGMPQYVAELLLDGRLVGAVPRRVAEHHAREAEEGAVLLTRLVPRHVILGMEWRTEGSYNSILEKLRESHTRSQKWQDAGFTHPFDHIEVTGALRSAFHFI